MFDSEKFFTFVPRFVGWSVALVMFIGMIVIPFVEVTDRPVKYVSALTGKCTGAVEWEGDVAVERDCSWLKGKRNYSTIIVEDEEQFPNL